MDNLENSENKSEILFSLTDDDFDNAVAVVKKMSSVLYAHEPELSIRAGLLSLVYLYSLFCTSLIAKSAPNLELTAQDAPEVFNYVYWSYIQEGVFTKMLNKYEASLHVDNLLKSVFDKTQGGTNG